MKKKKRNDVKNYFKPCLGRPLLKRNNNKA